MSHTSSERRVVITGLGVVSPLGIGADLFWENLAAGRSGIGPVQHLSYSAAPQNMAGEVRDFTDESAKKIYLKDQRKSIKVMCREIQLGVASATLALGHAQVDVETLNRERFGVDFGANLMFSPPEVLKDACWKCVDDTGGRRTFRYDDWGTVGLPAMEPLWLLRYLPNMPACHIGISNDARGPSNSITLDEASGNLALAEAFRIIVRDRADIMIAGTTGTRLHAVKTIHASLWDELASSGQPPETWCRPFDRDRNGQVVGEGACSFILEEESHAKTRGATVLGMVLGAGSSCVMDRTGKPDPRQALANAMRSALRDAGIEPEQVGHINAHGLGSRRADLDEARAIQAVFGARADQVPVTALKSWMGNSGSGCGTLELAGSLLGLRQGVIPPTRNCDHPDLECGLNVVRGAPLATANKVVLNINVTRMGQASALVVQGA